MHISTPKYISIQTHTDKYLLIHTIHIIITYQTYKYRPGYTIHANTYQYIQYRSIQIKKYKYIPIHSNMYNTYICLPIQVSTLKNIPIQTHTDKYLPICIIHIITNIYKFRLVHTIHTNPYQCIKYRSI